MKFNGGIYFIFSVEYKDEIGIVTISVMYVFVCLFSNNIFVSPSPGSFCVLVEWNLS